MRCAVIRRVLRAARSGTGDEERINGSATRARSTRSIRPAAEDHGPQGLQERQGRSGRDRRRGVAIPANSWRRRGRVRREDRFRAPCSFLGICRDRQRRGQQRDHARIGRSIRRPPTGRTSDGFDYTWCNLCGERSVRRTTSRATRRCRRSPRHRHGDHRLSRSAKMGVRRSSGLGINRISTRTNRRRFSSRTRTRDHRAALRGPRTPRLRRGCQGCRNRSRRRAQGRTVATVRAPPLAHRRTAGKSSRIDDVCSGSPGSSARSPARPADVRPPIRCRRRPRTKTS